MAKNIYTHPDEALLNIDRSLIIEVYFRYLLSQQLSTRDRSIESDDKKYC